VRRRGSPAAEHVTVDDMLDGDGFWSFIFGAPGPCATLPEAAGVWEKLRPAAWDRWAADLVGSYRGPYLWPPYAARTHDRFGDAAALTGYPVAGSAEQALDAVAADLAALDAFVAARPSAAAEIAGPLATYRAQLRWLADVAESAGDDRAKAGTLLYGQPPAAEGDDDD